MSCAIITGASSGIGKEFALQLRADYGIDEFWLVARNIDRLNAVKAELGDGVKCKIISADLGTTAGIEEYRRQLTEECPEVMILINAAGFGVFGAFDTISEKTVSDFRVYKTEFFHVYTNG